MNRGTPVGMSLEVTESLLADFDTFVTVLMVASPSTK